MDILDGMLKDKSTNYTLAAPIRAACQLARKVLNKYYAKTDDPIMYCCAISEYLLYFCTSASSDLCCSYASASQDPILQVRRLAVDLN